MAPASPSQSLIGGRYKSGPRIGAGSFGEVFLGNDQQTGAQVAIKTEPSTAMHGCLEREVRAYRALSKSERVPRILWEGVGALNSRVMVTELMGPSLADLLEFCGKRFSLKTTLMLMGQMLECLEAVHAAGLVHRDLKPDNFLIGLGEKASTVHIIDFGLSTAWIDRRTRDHVPYRENRGHVGTARYSSVGSHFGRQQSRRDDLESLGYLMLYFLQGSLPWQHAQLFCRDDKERLREIQDRKAAMTVDRLCHRHPPEIAMYLRYARSLQFEECPDYMYMKNVLGDLFEERGYEDDGIFDWTILAHGLTESSERNKGAEGKKDRRELCATRASERVSSDEVEA
mmetsp:Transcript_18046/g.51300  ORF Transcript_18046/g.51300 Transcript_18046/m.51300 type:complete len:342 (+) Transcript_18046:54-1079(+)